MKKFLWFSLFYLFTFSALIVECSGGGRDDEYRKQKFVDINDEGYFGDDSEDSDSVAASASEDFWGSSPAWIGEGSEGLSAMIAAYQANPVGDDASDDEHAGGGGGAAPRDAAVPGAGSASDLVDAIVASLGGLELEDDDKIALCKLRLLIKDLEHDLQKKVSDEKKLNLEEAQRLLGNYALMIQKEIDLNNKMDDLSDDEVAVGIIDIELNDLTLNIDLWRGQVNRLTSKYEIMKSRESQDRPVIGAKRTKSKKDFSDGAGGGGGAK